MTFEVYLARQLPDIASAKRLSDEQVFAMQVVASVLPFRVNNYVVDHLIDWENPETDPIFQLTFPQEGMLDPQHFASMASLLRAKADRQSIHALAQRIRRDLNPHPAGQREVNVPQSAGKEIEGIQHKYRETVLFFPPRGQTCHAYCTFCFRWAQFVGERELLLSARDTTALHRYLKAHREVTDLLITGGDPLVMKTAYLAQYLEPLLGPEHEHVQTLRIGTKAFTFWPFRFLTDPDAEDLLRLFERLVANGKHVALMAHFNHWREMESAVAQEAIRRVRGTGVVIRTQAPVLAHVNDSPAVWVRMWRSQIRLGMVPYYMFVERDTGARRYFEVPLERTWLIYRDAIQQISGLGRTARGPSMSTGPGKIEIQGVVDLSGERVFVLRFLQGRNPDWIQKPFFARYNAQATWFDHLEPAFGEERFFFEDEYQEMCAEISRRVS